MENVIGQRIKDIIETLNISKSEFCSKINIATTVLYNIINGRNKPSYDLLGKIINTFDVDPNYLLKGTGEMFISNDGSKMNTDVDSAKITSEKKNLINVNVSENKQVGKMQGDSGGAMGGYHEKNMNTRGNALPGTTGDKAHENNDITMKTGQNDIIESNKEFFDEYQHGAYADLQTDNWEYLQIRYYEPMSIHRLKTLYSAEIEGLRAIYNSHKQLVEILHYLNPAEFLLEKFPLEPDFTEYFKEANEEWNEDFEVLKDKKLELILKILHIKESTDHQAGLLAKLINYMSMYKDMLPVGKTLK